MKYRIKRAITVLVVAIVLFAAVFLAAFAAIAAAHASAKNDTPCVGKPGSLEYSFCALHVSFPRNIVFCSPDIENASHCLLARDGDADPYQDTFAILGHYYYGPTS